MILVIGGSPRQFGRTQALSNHIASTLTQLGADVVYVNLAETKLPLYDDSPGAESASDGYRLEGVSASGGRVLHRHARLSQRYEWSVEECD